MSNNSPPSVELREAHRLYLRLTRSESADQRIDLIRAILLNPASDDRLKAACAVVMRHWMTRSDLRADVMQEAVLRLTDHFLKQDLHYDDRGPDQFGGWLWSMWYYACREAWRHCRPLWLKGMQLTQPEAFAELPDHHLCSTST
jgi:hypothetical protein